MIRFDNENTFKEELKNGINLFLGAGFSVYAKNSFDEFLPVGNELLNTLKKTFNINGTFSLPQVATILESTKRAEFYKFLKEKFKVANFDERYKSIDKLNPKNIYTTNIDNLIDCIYAKNKFKYINDVSHRGKSINDPTAIDYSALHGCVNNDDRKLVFDVSSLTNVYSNNPRIWNQLSLDFEVCSTLFWGYGLNDTGVIQALTSTNSLKSAHKDKWIIIREEELDSVGYFEALGFNIIISNTNEFLDYLTKLTFNINLDKLKPNPALEYLFKKNIVPKNSIGFPVRPIIDFYSGMPPSWFDIFSNSIFKTSHFNTIKDLILSQRNVIVLGGPVTGKSTLLMQLAAFVEFKGHKLIFENLNLDKANRLIEVLNGEKALLFFDNFSDYYEAFNRLSEIKNITLIGFERSHNYGIISHLLMEKSFKFINVTNLKDSDLQGIYDTLPLSHRKSFLTKEKNDKYEKDSIYEFIHRNIKNSSIKERYNNVLDELSDKDDRLAQFLVLTAYVHYSRVPLSFDMLLSYFYDDINSYEELYELRNCLSDLIKEYSGELEFYDNQDYYFPRSFFIAETILDLANHNLLKNVIKKTLDNVPNTRIPMYHTFKKYAYDKNLILRAFKNWKEGKEFYEKVYKYDFHNPHVLQQGALYLAQMKKFNDAFEWIDRAITQSNNKFFSIRNSHAIILFDANINNKAENLEIRNQLDYSMEILEKCIKDDKRKVFHAVRYAEQSLEYIKRYFDDKAKNYIRKAKEWLNEEKYSRILGHEIKNLIIKLEEIKI